MSTPTNDSPAQAKAIRNTLDALLDPDQVVEPRIMHTSRGTQSGYYDDLDALARDAAAHDGKAPAIYFTLNPVNPDLLARAKNRLKPYAKDTTGDKDIADRVWFPIDFDPVRPAGISSTDAEHEAALDRARVCRDWLAGLGWRAAFLADSGNGAHLLYCIDLRNDCPARDLIKRCLEALALQFSDGLVAVDVTTFNAARIWKLYGTRAAKGDATEDRPHRTSRLLEAPRSKQLVGPDQLAALAAMVPSSVPRRPARSPRNGHEFDLAEWVTEHADVLPVVQAGPWLDGTKYILNPCPWNAEHTNRSAYIVQHAGGGIAAGCHHNGCRGHDWPSLRALVGSGRQSATGSVAPPAPATEPPDLAVLLADVRTFIRRYVVLTSEQATAVTLWVAHTHTIEASDTTPFLHITSATKRAGKTRLLEVLERLVANAWLTGRTSAAALVRKVDADSPTLLLDESDAAFGGEKEYAEALRGILNSGYKRSGKCSLCVGKGVEIAVKDFSTFSAKAIAGIGRLPDTVADRAIPAVLRRRMATEPVHRWRDRDGRAEAAPLHRRLQRWAQSALEPLRGARPILPPALSDRAADVWEPLLAIADPAGGDWPEQARPAAVNLMGAVEDTDPVIELLTDIERALRKNITTDVVPSKALIEQLIAVEDRPWATWRRGEKPITERGLARLLGPLDIHPDRHETPTGRCRGYRRVALVEAIARYLPVHVSMRPDPNKNGGETVDTCDFGSEGNNACVRASEAQITAFGTHGHIDRGDDRACTDEGANDADRGLF